MVHAWSIFIINAYGSLMFIMAAPIDQIDERDDSPRPCCDQKYQPRLINFPIRLTYPTRTTASFPLSATILAVTIRTIIIMQAECIDHHRSIFPLCLMVKHDANRVMAEKINHWSCAQQHPSPASLCKLCIAATWESKRPGNPNESLMWLFNHLLHTPHKV